MLNRQLFAKATERLKHQPAAVLLGPRQVGKSTLARQLAAAQPGAIFLDMEDAADRAKLTQPRAFLNRFREQLVVIDEVQAMPDLFVELRPEIDADRRPGRFLLLGSASGKLLHQSAESLAGRVAYLELSPFLVSEIDSDAIGVSKLWQRGGFPNSFLASSDVSSQAWRADFIKTLLARDLPQLGVTISAETLRRFWTMCAHLHGQLFNASQLGLALGGLAHSTVARYLDLLVDAMVLRRLEPWHANVSKRLTKSPKVYVRDSGLLHTLLGLTTPDLLGAHPVAGLSWEGFVIEQVIATLPPLANYGFYRTAAGAELDLVIEHAGRITAIEIKLSNAPKVQRGFWTACDDLGVSRALVVAPVTDNYPLADNVEVIPPQMLAALFA